MSTPPDPSTPYPVRALRDADWEQFLATDSHAFGMTVPTAFAEAERPLHDMSRGLAAFDGPTMAGIATAYDFDLAVPGGRLPAAGVTWVGVLPTHRRRGVLRGLMTRQLHDVHDTGREPLAVLWASEPPIYGRFGYGAASASLSLTVARNPQALTDDTPRDPGLRLRLVAGDDWKLTQTVYDVAAARRPGTLGRDERWWTRAVSDHTELREGKSELRCVVAEDRSGVRGYARYATKPGWTPGRPDGTVHVREVMAVDPAASAEVYRYLFDLDLMSTTELWNTPIDDPLLLWLRNPRGAQPRLFDTLYVRLVDLPRALGGRTYSGPVDVVLEVRDDLLTSNAGRWRLTGGPDGAECVPAPDGAAPDLALDVRDLGAAYLGGTTLVDLAAAGRVESRSPDVLAATSAAFRHEPAPWCPVVF